MHLRWNCIITLATLQSFERWNQRLLIIKYHYLKQSQFYVLQQKKKKKKEEKSNILPQDTLSTSLAQGTRYNE